MDRIELTSVNKYNKGALNKRMYDVGGPLPSQVGWDTYSSYTPPLDIPWEAQQAKPSTLSGGLQGSIDPNLISPSGLPSLSTPKPTLFDKAKDFANSEIGGAVINAAAVPIGGMMNKGISGGLSSGAGNTIGALGSTVGGAVGQFNPLIGAAVTVGSQMLGGVTNRLFGSKLNDENINTVKNVNSGIMGAGNVLAGAQSNDDIMDSWGNTNMGFDFSKGFIGKDGAFSHEARNKYKKLQNQMATAKGYALHGLEQGLDNTAQAQIDDLSANYFGDGGGIHINPENRGKFTETMRRTGKSAEELLHSPNPLTRKRAQFAINARKFNHKHDEGGNLLHRNTDIYNNSIFNTRQYSNGGDTKSEERGTTPIGRLFKGDDAETADLIWGGAEFAFPAIGPIFGVADIVNDVYNMSKQKHIGTRDLANLGLDFAGFIPGVKGITKMAKMAKKAGAGKASEALYGAARKVKLTSVDGQKDLKKGVNKALDWNGQAIRNSRNIAKRVNNNIAYGRKAIEESNRAYEASKFTRGVLNDVQHSLSPWGIRYNHYKNGVQAADAINDAVNFLGTNNQKAYGGYYGIGNSDSFYSSKNERNKLFSEGGSTDRSGEGSTPIGRLFKGKAAEDADLAWGTAELLFPAAGTFFGAADVANDIYNMAKSKRVSGNDMANFGLDLVGLLPGAKGIANIAKIAGKAKAVKTADKMNVVAKKVALTEPKSQNLIKRDVDNTLYWVTEANNQSRKTANGLNKGYGSFDAVRKSGNGAYEASNMAKGKLKGVRESFSPWAVRYSGYRNVLKGADAANDMGNLTNTINQKAYGGSLYNIYPVVDDPYSENNNNDDMNTNDTLFALGGDLQSHGTDWGTGLVDIANGGTHEENPYEGVQMGIADDGQPNLVEEGETIFDDYVFSNRIQLDDDALNQMRLGKKGKGKTYAAVSKMLTKEAEERPNDPISQAALKKRLTELQEAQEDQKQRESEAEAMEAFENLSPEQKQQVMAQLAQQQGQEMPMEQQEASVGPEEAAVAPQGQQMEEQPTEEEMMQQEAPMHANGGNLHRFDNGGWKTQLADMLGLHSQSEWRKFAKEAGLKDFDFNNYSDDLAGLNNLREIADYQKIVDAINKQNKALAHAIKNGYSYGLNKEAKSGYDWGRLEKAMKAYDKSLIKSDNDPLRYNKHDNTKMSVFGPGEYEDIKKYEESPAYTKFTDKVENFINSKPTWTVDADGNITGLSEDKIPYAQYLTTVTNSVPKGTNISNLLVNDNGKISLNPNAGEWYKIGRQDGIRGILHFNPYTNNVEPVSNNYLINGDNVEDYIGTPTGNPVNTYTWVDKDGIRHTNNYYQGAAGSAEQEEAASQRKPMGYSSEIGLNAPLLMDMAQMAMHGMGVGKPDFGELEASANSLRPEQANATYIGDYMTYTPMDIWSEQNRADQNSRATARAIMNSSAPIATRNAALLANEYNRQIGNGDLATQARAYNDRQRQAVAAFNRGTNAQNAETFNQLSRFNAGMRNAFNNANASVRGDIAATKMNAKNQWDAALYQGLANIGQHVYNQAIENRNHNRLAMMYNSGDLAQFPDEEMKKYEDARKRGKGFFINI